MGNRDWLVEADKGVAQECISGRGERLVATSDGKSVQTSAHVATLQHPSLCKAQSSIRPDADRPESRVPDKEDGDVKLSGSLFPDFTYSRVQGGPKAHRRGGRIV